MKRYPIRWSIYWAMTLTLAAIVIVTYVAAQREYRSRLIYHSCPDCLGHTKEAWKP